MIRLFFLAAISFFSLDIGAQLPAPTDVPQVPTEPTQETQKAEPKETTPAKTTVEQPTKETEAQPKQETTVKEDTQPKKDTAPQAKEEVEKPKEPTQPTEETKAEPEKEAVTEPKEPTPAQKEEAVEPKDTTAVPKEATPVVKAKEVAKEPKIKTVPKVPTVVKEPKVKLPKQQVLPTKEPAITFPKQPTPKVIPKKPTVPTVPTDVTAPKAKEQEDDLLDTINIDEGFNWLEVRKMLEDTIDQIEKINSLFIKVLDVRMDYLKQRNQIDKEFDTFISQIGFDLGDLSSTLDTMREIMKKDQEEDGDLTAAERAFVQKVKEKKNTLKQLQKDIAAITDLDESIDKIIMTVEDQINTARKYQTQAWQNFQTLKKSPQRSQELLAKTRGLYESMNDIYTGYLKGKLLQHFNETLQTMRNQMNKISSQLQSLKSAGIDLQKEIDTLQKQDEQEDRERLEDELEAQLKKELEEQEKQKAEQEKTTWFATIKNIAYYPVQKMLDLWDYIMSFFG